MSTNQFDIRKSITDFAAEAGAWLAPLPSAAFSSNAASKHMGLGVEMSLIVGAVVELLGLATANRAFALWEYNATRSDDQPQAPTWIASGMFGLYLASTIGLSVLADVDPNMVKWLPAIMPVMAMAGTVTVALGKQHDLRMKRNAAIIAKRDADAREAEEERKRQAAEAKADAERLRLEEKAEREARRQERSTRQATRQSARHDATGGGVDRDTFVKLFTSRAYDDVSDLAHAHGFNGELSDFYTQGRRSVSRLAALTGVNPRTAQRWIDAASVALPVAPVDATHGVN